MYYNSNSNSQGNASVKLFEEMSFPPSSIKRKRFLCLREAGHEEGGRKVVVEEMKNPYCPFNILSAINFGRRGATSCFLDVGPSSICQC